MGLCMFFTIKAHDLTKIDTSINKIIEKKHALFTWTLFIWKVYSLNSSIFNLLLKLVEALLKLGARVD
jgi:hypothetical protein